MGDVFRVGHLSDTHFLEPRLEPEGGHAYDNRAAFDAVLNDLRDRHDLDLIVVTSDIADHGRPEQYEIRGFGGGHTHIPSTYGFAEGTVFVAPSLKHNFDLDANTWLPPGYRTYEFGDDGRVASDVHLVDDERWPRRPFGRAIRSLFMGEITFEQLAEIVTLRSR